MSTDEQDVIKAATRFYDALEQLISGKGVEAMRNAWHHTDHVTSGHPSGEWSQGWDEILATWEVFAGFGREDRGGSSIRGLKAHVYGDIAYTTCNFKAPAAYGGDVMACTNILQRVNGEWKIIHHHADKSPAMGAALERIATGG